MSASDTPSLPTRFRKWDISHRRDAVRDLLSQIAEDNQDPGRTDRPLDPDQALGTDPDLVDLADVMVESAVGYLALPLGICRGIVVDGRTLDVPLATEEPSVIAAVTYASGIVARNGGFTTWAADPVTTGQVFIEPPAAGTTDLSPDALSALLRENEKAVLSAIAPVIANMEKRGGGYRGMDVVHLPETGLVRFQIHIDVRDAMGANIVNSAAEAARPVLEEAMRGRCLMAILTNSADRRLASASFSAPVTSLGRSGLSGEEVARRIVLGGRLAEEDPDRAVTHNKGVMNGITALLLATGNDTRAAEAGVHKYAGRSGSYRGVASYEISGGMLEGRIEIPLAVGTVGGAAGIHPTSRMALAMLGNPGASGLARIAAAIGLAQNLAAVSALVTEGIQRGHMSLHARRLAWQAGARGAERDEVAARIVAGGVFNTEAAAAALEAVRAETRGADNGQTPEAQP